MSSESQNVQPSTLTRLAASLLGLPWVEILAEAWKLGRKIWRGLANEGMYEVLEYESTLELHDTTGLGSDYQQRLPDGRWRISLEKHKPRLYEHYILRWDW